MNRRRLLIASMAAAAISASAITPLWLRDVRIAPDGKQIAFTYKGDIYTVPTAGGQAVRLTSNDAHESNPVWSPDGREIAFASDRDGSFDIYIMPSTGGQPARLTVNSSKELPQGFTPDGKYVLYSAAIQDPARSAMFPTGVMTELYKVPVKGGRPLQMLGTPALNVSFTPDGKEMYYEDVKGSESDKRKHHTSSVTRDVWSYDMASGKHTNVTLRGGEDRNPVVSPDGNTVYFLSERNGGSFNVWSMPKGDASKTTQVTRFNTHPVRFLSQAGDGTLAFTYDGEIYTMRGTEKPRKVKIDLVADNDDPLKKVSVSRAGSGEVSADGKQIAFVNRGEVFVTSTEYGTTKQITRTPEGESDVIWGPSERELIYTSERDGNYNLYRAKIARDEDPNFANATVIEEELILPVDGTDRTMPSLSPDGKKLAFIADRNRLMVMDMDTKKVKQLTDGSINSYRTKGFGSVWSPDSKWLAVEYSGADRNPYSDIAIINAESGEFIPLTNTGYFDGNPHWALDGNAIIFESERYGMRNHASWGSMYDEMIVFLNREAFDKFRLSEEDFELVKEVKKAQKKTAAKKDGEKKEVVADNTINVERGDFEARTVRLTPNSSSLSDAIISKDGKTLYYLAEFEKGHDLWKKDLRKGTVSLVNKLGAGGSMQMDKDGNIFIIGSKIKKFDPKTSKMKDVNVRTTMTVDPAKEREYMLRYVFNEERERFYRTDMHGVDWKGMYKAYAKFLPHIDNNYDFADMLSELLGELNVSHTGGRYYPSGANEPTASLGVLLDMTYDGEGLRVDEVVAGGPFDHADSRMVAGALITAINGEKIPAGADYTALLNNLARKKTLVSFRLPQTNETVEEVVLPITAANMSNLLYNRWVKQREEEVDRLSGGRLGYVHIKSMDDESFRRVYAKVMGEYKSKDGIVIDTRWNGGGRLHEDIEVLFSGKKYLTQMIHGKQSSIMPSRRWTKPSIMITGEANYSNAHGTPWVYRKQNLGKIVGMPVPGTMTSVNWVRLQDNSLVFGIPVTGFLTEEGNYLENSQLEPDVKVANDPATVVTGDDRQLRVAVETLMKDLK